MAKTAPPPLPTNPQSSPPTNSSLPARSAASPPSSGVPLPKNDDPVATGEKMILIGIEGFGKTTTGCNAPDATIMMSALETGYFKLREAGRVPKIPYSVCKSWNDAMGLLDHFIKNGCSKWLILDALGGFERMCHDMVCERAFKNDRSAFTHFHKGYEVAVTDWEMFLQKLEKIAAAGTNIMATCHYNIRETPNPMGADFNQFIPDLHKYTWNITNRWADDVLFGTFFTEVEKIDGENKGVGGQTRVVYTSHYDAVNAKNKWGMTPMLFMPNDPAETFNTIWGDMHKQSIG